MRYLIAVGAALASAAWYVIHCVWFRSGSGRSWRKCRRCKGSGERLRIGRRAYNYFAARRREAK
jgi:hypothetical protein